MPFTSHLNDITMRRLERAIQNLKCSPHCTILDWFVSISELIRARTPHSRRQIRQIEIRAAAYKVPGWFVLVDQLSSVLIGELQLRGGMMAALAEEQNESSM